MSFSMHEIAEKRGCRRCQFGDLKALEYNKQAHKREDWDDYRPFCNYAFKINWQNPLKCDKWRMSE